MSKPTEAQVRKLELAHKEQYIRLVAANRLWIKLFTQIYKLPKTDPKWKSLYAFGTTIAKQAGSWYARQKNLEVKGKIPTVRPDIVKYFLVPKDELKLITVANDYLDPTKETIKINGLGIIPLLIWGVVIIILAFTAFEITDELNTTAEEKATLMKQTEQTLKDLNVTGPEAAAIISSTQAQASAGETSLFSGPKLLIIAGIAAFVLLKKS